MKTKFTVLIVIVMVSVFPPSVQRKVSEGNYSASLLKSATQTTGTRRLTPDTEGRHSVIIVNDVEQLSNKENSDNRKNNEFDVTLMERSQKVSLTKRFHQPLSFSARNVSAEHRQDFPSSTALVEELTNHQSSVRVPRSLSSPISGCSCSSDGPCYYANESKFYQIRELTVPTNRTTTIQDLIYYVDNVACPADYQRVSVKNQEEAGFLINCFLCGDTSFGAAQQKRNIITSGRVDTKYVTETLSPLDALSYHGIWEGRGWRIESGIPDSVFLLDSETGVQTPDDVTGGVYVVLLLGNDKQYCDSPTTYSSWGLLSYQGRENAVKSIGYALCEKLVDYTEPPVTDSTTTTSTIPSTTTTSTTTSSTTTTSTTTSSTTTPSTTITSFRSSTITRLPLSTTSTSTGLLETISSTSVTPEECCTLPNNLGTVCTGSNTTMDTCKTGYNGWQVWSCLPPGPRLNVTEDHCILQWIQDAQDQVNAGNDPAEQIIAKLENHTHQEDLTSNDLHALVGLFSNLTSLMEKQLENVALAIDRINRTYSYTNDFTSTASNLLSKSETWDSIDSPERGLIGSKLLTELEVTGFLMAKQITEDDVQFNSPQVNMTVFSTPRNRFEGLDYPDRYSPTFIHIPQSIETLLPEEMQVEAVGFLLMQDAAARAIPAVMNNVSGGDFKEVNSPVVSMSVGRAGHSLNLSDSGEMVTLRLHHTIQESGPYFRDLYRDPRPGETPTPVPRSGACVYWDTSSRIWSTDGCEPVNSTLGETYCQCNHLTMISIITDIHQYVGRDPILDMLGTILTTASFVSLLLAFFIFQFCKSIHSPRTSITKQLCVSLGLSHLFLILLLDRDFLKQSESLCEASAAILHYLLSSGVCWMMAEGCHLFKIVHQPLSPTNYMPIFWLLGYGVPAVIVMVTLLVAYGTKSWTSQIAYAPPGSEYCWLSTEQGFIWAFTGPLIVVIVLNTVCMGLTLRSTAILAVNKRKSLPQQIKLWVKGCFSLTCILGTTWVFGLLYINTGHFFAYVFTILNGSQGIMILVLHCLLNESVRSGIINSLPHALAKHFTVKKVNPSSPGRSIKRSKLPTPKCEASMDTSFVTHGTPPRRFSNSNLPREILNGGDQQEPSTPRVAWTKRHGSQWSNATQLSCLSDPYNSDSSSGRRASSDSYQSSASVSSATFLVEYLQSLKHNTDAVTDVNDNTGANIDQLHYVPEFDTIVECDERSPRPENAISFRF